MAGKRKPTKRDVKPPRTDNLKLINGIGPTVEKRLFDDGIYTYAHLAAFLPGDIAAKLTGVTGMSAKRIIREDWIGQASKLAAKSTSSELHRDLEAEPVTPVPTNHTRPVTRGDYPQNLAREPISKEEKADFEAILDSDIIDQYQANLQQKQPIELTHSVTLLKEPQKNTETVVSKEQLHPATFTVELLLDDNNNVQNTYVVHVQSRHEHRWSNWPQKELLEFLERSAWVNVPQTEAVHVEPIPAITEESEHTTAAIEEPKHVPVQVAESTPLVEIPSLAGTLHLRDLKILGAGSPEPRSILPHNQPFNVHLTLDLSELKVPAYTPLIYRASIYGKIRGSRAGQTVGEAEGTIKTTDVVDIDVEGSPLPEGTYRIAANVIVALPGMKLTPRPGTIAIIDAGLVQVY